MSDDEARLLRHGRHLFATARSLGWEDDGEGALEFVVRRISEVAIEDCKRDPVHDRPGYYNAGMFASPRDRDPT